MAKIKVEVWLEKDTIEKLKELDDNRSNAIRICVEERINPDWHEQ